ncbi:unnamed protein product [Adineta ricciae]|uniref:Phosphoglycerate mutase n=1 Tax=Adineta ricciae TaxID=249248 RepID=A0A813SLM5_ADIRI|nr:unnamed protein product [Adineta ricciae]
MVVYKLILLRHGESEWNEKNLFCGWNDVDLSQKGIEEGKQAGKWLKEQGYTFDVAYTSVLKRAIKTLYLIQEELDLHWTPVYRHWRLNERVYGDLQGKNKAQTVAKYGEDQVKIWRRAYDIPPPPLDESSEYNPKNDPKYQNVDKRLLPLTECLKDTFVRILPYWHDHIAPSIRSGQNVLICVHGTAVRALIKYLDQVSDGDISKIDVPTGIPLIYELDENMNPIRHYYVAPDDVVKKAIEKVMNQGKAKQ